MEFPTNSNKAKEEKQKPEKETVEKVVTGEVVKRKKPLGRRFKEVFLGAEFKGAAQYITGDVLLPAVRNMVVDATTKGIERFVYGDTAPSSRRRSHEARSRVSYNSPVQRSGRPVHLPDQPPHTGRRRQEANEVILSSREDAEIVLERLIDIIDKYDVASVADLNDLLGHPSTFVDNKWGWSALHYVDIRQVREGFLIDLPSAEPL